MDLPPTMQLRIVDVSTRPLPTPAGGTLQHLLSEALRQRPDLIAAVARLRATDEEIALARATFLPKLSVSGNIQGNFGQISVDGMPYQSVKQPQAGIFLRFDWPLYQGGLLQNPAAGGPIQAGCRGRRRSRRPAIRRCGKLRLPTIGSAPACSNTEAARALLTSAQTAFSSATDSYAHGIATFTDAASAEGALAAALADVARAHAQSLINAAALAFATGALNANTAAGLPGASR